MANVISSWFGSTPTKQDLAGLFRLSLAAGDAASDYQTRQLFSGILKCPLTKAEVAQLDALVASYEAGATTRMRHGVDSLRAAVIQQKREHGEAVAAGKALPAHVDLDQEYQRHRTAGMAAMDAAGKAACRLFLEVAPRALEAVNTLLTKESEKDRKQAEELGVDAVDSAVVIGLRKVKARLELELAKLRANPDRSSSPLSLFQKLGYGPALPPPPAPPKPDQPRTETPKPAPARPTLSREAAMREKELMKRELARRGEINLAVETK